MLRTPLYDIHQAAGATFTPFAGYDMPVHYGSIKDEHNAVRQSVGLFDVSHMSNVWVRGPRAAAALARVTPSNPEALPLGKGKYTVLLHEDGTILDDAFYFRTQDDEYLLIPNAGMNGPACDHLRQHTPEAQIEDVTSEWAILALQGPNARATLKAASSDTPPKFHRIVTMQIGGRECLVSGTGYTGEKGVEIYVPASDAEAVWAHLMQAGAPHGIRPIGLGARDTLRLEKGYCLAGHEFAGGKTPLEANLGWIIDWDGNFIGKQALEAQRAEGHALLFGFKQARGVPRQGYNVLRGGEIVGNVTSGTMSPTLGLGIGLAYVTGGEIGQAVEIDVRGRPVAAELVKLPFVE